MCMEQAEDKARGQRRACTAGQVEHMAQLADGLLVLQLLVGVAQDLERAGRQRVLALVRVDHEGHLAVLPLRLLVRGVKAQPHLLERVELESSQDPVHLIVPVHFPHFQEKILHDASVMMRPCGTTHQKTEAPLGRQTACALSRGAAPPLLTWWFPLLAMPPHCQTALVPPLLQPLLPGGDQRLARCLECLMLLVAAVAPRAPLQVALLGPVEHLMGVAEGWKLTPHAHCSPQLWIHRSTSQNQFASTKLRLN